MRRTSVTVATAIVLASAAGGGMAAPPPPPPDSPPSSAETAAVAVTTVGVLTTPGMRALSTACETRPRPGPRWCAWVRRHPPAGLGTVLLGTCTPRGEPLACPPYRTAVHWRAATPAAMPASPVVP